MFQVISFSVHVRYRKKHLFNFIRKPISFIGTAPLVADIIQYAIFMIQSGNHSNNQLTATHRICPCWHQNTYTEPRCSDLHTYRLSALWFLNTYYIAHTPATREGDILPLEPEPTDADWAGAAPFCQRRMMQLLPQLKGNNWLLNCEIQYIMFSLVSWDRLQRSPWPHSGTKQQKNDGYFLWFKPLIWF